MPRATSGPMLLSHPGSVFMTLDTIDGHTHDRCLGHHLGPGWCLKATHPRGHTDLNGLCRHLGPWWHLSSGFYQGPIWVQSTTTAWDLCWCLWPKLPPIATRMPEVLATTCGYIHVQGLCCCPGYADLSGQFYHMMPWCHSDQGCCHRPCLRLWPYCLLSWYLCLLLPPRDV